MKMKMISNSRTRSASSCGFHRAGGWSFHLLYSVLLLCTDEMHGLADFSTYLFRIIISQSAHARDGELLLLSCPRHSTISVQSAVYRPPAPLPYCNAPTALQKMLSECQDQRNCQILVNYRLFGRDLCPGTTKHLHVSYGCKPTENKNRTRCEGDKMILHCKYPKLLNIYSAVYGRELGEKTACLTEEDQPPPFVPQSLFKEADPTFFQTTIIPQETTNTGKPPDVRESKLKDINGVLVSNSLMAYGYIKGYPEKAGLVFISGVCLGLFIVLVAISTRITCTTHFEGICCLNKKTDIVEPKDEDDENSDDEESELLMDSSMMSEVGRKVYCWEEAMYTTEAAELIERLERREMIIQEISMNSYLNGTSCTLH
ncbi:protein eva-1 homolog C isoform X3 [Silurus meridionalis]|uniref:protein eva-1 homolog C isoform X3 n=1 Tax=Silurus meridionalis TaxID=175797 RepID=UPI001EEA02A3|nr:protein eva-1 homolog C isoform X3 [Silurus meridionalis]